MMTKQDMEKHMMVGDANTIAERIAEDILLARPCKDRPRFPAGGSSTALALRGIEGFENEMRPLLERQISPLDRRGVTAAA
jgi:hypothetical protein